MKKCFWLMSAILALALVAIFTPTAAAAATFKVSDLSISPTFISAGSEKQTTTTTISVKVANIGTEAGTYKAELKINDNIEATKDVILKPGENQTVMFPITKTTVGEYNVAIGDLKGVFSIAPASLEIKNLLIEPLEINPGKEVVISVTAQNKSSDQPLTYDSLKLFINGTVADKKRIDLKAGESTTISFRLTKSAVGNYVVQIGPKTGSFAVKASLFASLPTFVWVIIGAIVLIVIIMAVMVLTAPKKKKAVRVAGKPGRVIRGQPPTTPVQPIAVQPPFGQQMTPYPGQMQSPPSQGMSQFPGQQQPIPPRPAAPFLGQQKQMPQQPFGQQQMPPQPFAPQQTPPYPGQMPQTPPYPRQGQGQPQPSSPSIPQYSGQQQQSPPRPPVPFPGQQQMPQQPFAPQQTPPYPGQMPQTPPTPFPRQQMPPVKSEPFGPPSFTPMPQPPAFAPQPFGMPPGRHMPQFTVSNLTITPQQVKEGDPVNISAVVTNNSTATGHYSMVLRIGGVVENISELTLNPGASQTALFTVIKDAPGEYYVEVDGQRSILTVIHRLPAAFSVSNLTITPDRVKQGEPITITAIVTNSGETPGNYSVVLKIKGIAESIEEVELGPGRSQKVAFTVTKDAAGFYPVALENLSGRFVVEMDWKG